MRRTLTGRVATVGTTAFESTATRTTPEPPVPLCRRELATGSKRGGIDAQECLCLSEGRKAFHPAIIRIMLGRLGRPHHDKFVVHSLNYLGQIFAVGGAHMPRAAVRTVVLARARPFVSPLIAAPRARVVIAEPGQRCPPQSSDRKR